MWWQRLVCSAQVTWLLSQMENAHEDVSLVSVFQEICPYQWGHTVWILFPFGQSCPSAALCSSSRCGIFFFHWLSTLAGGLTWRVVGGGGGEGGDASSFFKRKRKNWCSIFWKTDCWWNDLIIGIFFFSFFFFIFQLQMSQMSTSTYKLIFLSQMTFLLHLSELLTFNKQWPGNTVKWLRC